MASRKQGEAFLNVVKEEKNLSVPVRYGQFPVPTTCGVSEFHDNTREQQVDIEHVLYFQRYLHEYALLHKRILTGKSPLRIVRLVCPTPDLPCDGWGDRTKGIFNVIVLGMMTKRAFVIGNATQITKDATIDMFYGDKDVIDWSSEINESATYDLKCFRKFKADCFIDVLKNGTLDNHSVIDVTTNLDHSFAIAREFPEFLRESRIHLIPFWKATIMKRFLPVKPMFETIVKNVIPRIPLIGVHIRTGHNEVPDFRYVEDVATRVDNYVKCIRKVCSKENATVFAAADTSDTLNLFREKLGTSWSVITADGLGEIAHNSFANASSQQVAMRLMIDFEILRRVPIIVASLSGFSLMAHRTRYYANSVGIIGADEGCARISTRHDGWSFSVSHW